MRLLTEDNYYNVVNSCKYNGKAEKRKNDQENLVRDIGISNFSLKKLNKLLGFAKTIPSVHVSGDGLIYTKIYIYIYIQSNRQKNLVYIYYIKETLHEQKCFGGSDGDASWLEK